VRVKRRLLELVLDLRMMAELIEVARLRFFAMLARRGQIGFQKLIGQRCAALLTVFCYMSSTLLAVVPQAVRAATANETVTLNFKDAEIDTVIGAFGHYLNRTFIIDPRVRGKLNLETPRAVTKAQAYNLLQAALRLQNFAIVENGDLSKVVPEADAKLQSGPVTAGRGNSNSSEQIVTQIFKLNYESASNLVPVLRPYISPNNPITAYPNNNSLVITDYAANLQRIARIIASLDSPSTNEVEVIPIKNTQATEVALTVARMLDDTLRAGAGAQIDPGQRATVMADPRLNAVMIRAASPAKMNLAKSLIARLDVASAQPGNINVVYLRNADAVKLAQVLKGVLSGDSSSTGANSGLQNSPASTLAPQGTSVQQGGQGASATPLQQSGTNQQPVTVNAGGAVIAADTATNSLIITATEPVFRNLRAVIDKLDARRAQVFIESLIVEVNAEKAAELGVQWQFGNPAKGGVQTFGGTNLSSGGSNILSASQGLAGLAAIGQGFNIGVLRGITTVAGATILNLGALAKALESSANGNVLATPNLLTLDNEEARIIIGQNVPFVTGQFSAQGTTGAAVNPFQTIERRDVGTTLRVKPQVSEGGTVKMQIFQEVSSVEDRSLAAGLITKRRAIESNVLVDDGQMVVLGGLIEEKEENSSQAVPFLGAIPILGQLFRYDARKRVKTNLLVFLRPVVVRGSDTAYSITADRYDYIQQLRGDSRAPSHWLLPDNPTAPMPSLPARPNADGSYPPGTEPNKLPSNMPRSLSPEINEVLKRRDAEGGGRTGIIRVAPNEVIVPISPGNTLREEPLSNSR
jgi:general secretion pathway protein D